MWCSQRHMRKHMFKMRDGPIDWWFCNEDCALDWLTWRHRNPTMYTFLKLPHAERAVELGDRTVWQYAQMSDHKSNA